jgi:hypothetical protein
LHYHRRSATSCAPDLLPPRLTIEALRGPLNALNVYLGGDLLVTSTRDATLRGLVP